MLYQLIALLLTQKADQACGLPGNYLSTYGIPDADLEAVLAGLTVGVSGGRG